jgi:hypothetical protein
MVLYILTFKFLDNTPRKDYLNYLACEKTESFRKTGVFWEMRSEKGHILFSDIDFIINFRHKLVKILLQT